MQGGTVKLQVYQEVSSVVALSITSDLLGVSPPTNVRSNPTVLVDENQIVVLGGLIQDSVTDVASKTPLLGDIPILGQSVPLRDAGAHQDQPDGVHPSLHHVSVGRLPETYRASVTSR